MTVFPFKKNVNVKAAQPCPTLCDPTDCSPWNSPGENTGVRGLSLLQGIFSTQGSSQVSHIAGGLLTSWVTREAQESWSG